MKFLHAWVVALLLQGALLTGAQDCPGGGCPVCLSASLSVYLSICLPLYLSKSHLVVCFMCGLWYICTMLKAIVNTTC